MDITYFGHSSFKLRTNSASLVTDPFSKGIGFEMPKISADIVTVSHDHFDHNHTSAVTGTARRDKPFIITGPGEYEIQDVSVFGVPTFHDDSNGTERGKNTVYVIEIGGVRVAHLGDLGHMLTDDQLEEIEDIDVLLCPVGGVYTIDAKIAANIIHKMQPAFAVPMHFRTQKHNPEKFADLAQVEDFISLMGLSEVKTLDKLTVNASNIMGDTEIVVLNHD